MSYYRNNGTTLAFHTLSPSDVYADVFGVIDGAGKAGWDIVDFRQPKAAENYISCASGEKHWCIKEAPNDKIRLPFFIVTKRKTVQFVVTVLENVDRIIQPGETGITSLTDLDIRVTSNFPSGWKLYPVKIERREV